MTKTTITLPRLACCLPQVVCYFLMKGHGKIYFEMTLLQNLMRCTVPPAIQTNVFSSLVPKDVFPDLKYYCYVYNFYLDRLLNSKSKKKFDTTISEVTLFTDAAMSSTFMSGASKLLFLRMLGLITRHNEPTQIFNDTMINSRKIWEAFTNSDSLHEAEEMLKKNINTAIDVDRPADSSMDASVMGTFCEEYFDTKVKMDSFYGGLRGTSSEDDIADRITSDFKCSKILGDLKQILTTKTYVEIKTMIHDLISVNRNFLLFKISYICSILNLRLLLLIVNELVNQHPKICKSINLMIKAYSQVEEVKLGILLPSGYTPSMNDDIVSTRIADIYDFAIPNSVHL